MSDHDQADVTAGSTPACPPDPVTDATLLGIASWDPLAPRPTLAPGQDPAASVGLVQSATLAHEQADATATNPAGHESSDRSTDVRPITVPGYELLEPLGEGGMGVVWKARQVKLNRVVALKMILGGHRSGVQELTRFLAEAEVLAAVRHPHVVQVHECGEASGRPFLAMEYLPGGSLTDRLKKSGRLDPKSAAELVETLAGAVQAAHDLGIVHRDLKPGNVLYDETGRPKVTDFGLAKRPGVSDLTATLVVLGTPAYMAPEQARGETKFVGPSADVYSLGVILYECLTGTKPFDAPDPLILLRKVAEEEPERLRKRVPGLPRDVELICLKCLAKEPAERYPTAATLAADLRKFAAGEPVSVRAAGVVERVARWARRKPTLAAAYTLGLLTVLFGGLGGAAVWQWREASRERAKASSIANYLSIYMLAASSAEVNPLGARFTVRDLLDRAGARIGGDLQGYPEIEASIRETVGKSYLSLGEFARAEPHLRAALKLDSELRGPADPATLRLSNVLALLLDQSGRADEAEALLRKTLDESRRALGPDDPIALEAADRLGAVLRAKKDLDEAEPLIRRALEGRHRILTVDHPDTLRSTWNLCLLEVARGRLKEADALADEYERGVRCARGPKHPDNVTALSNLGLIRILHGRPAEAEPFYRRAAEEARRILGEDHPTTRAAIAEHARLLRDLAGERALNGPGPDGSQK